MARTIVLHCARNETRPLETRIGAPVQIPISFHALVGLVTAPISAPTALTHIASSAGGAMKMVRMRPPMTIQNVIRTPMITPAKSRATP